LIAPWYASIKLFGSHIKFLKKHVHQLSDIHSIKAIGSRWPLWIVYLKVAALRSSGKAFPSFILPSLFPLFVLTLMIVAWICQIFFGLKSFMRESTSYVFPPDASYLGLNSKRSQLFDIIILNRQDVSQFWQKYFSQRNIIN